MLLDIGIQKKDRKVISEAIRNVLADTFTLYVKTLGFHWNVTGPNFHSLHNLFKELYEDLTEGSDLLAERIRALGYWAPSSFSECIQLSAIKEETSHIYDASDMLRQLALDNELMVRRLKEVFDVADTNNDGVSADIITQRMTIHSKVAWMLRSHLE